MTWNIAHRGGAGLWPENTLPAFRNAAALGSDGAELDVQLSADGIPMVHHDFRLNPALARKGGDWLREPTPAIKSLTAADLRAVDVGRANPDSEYAQSHLDLIGVDGAFIPALADVVAAVPSNFLLLVELKSSTEMDSCDPVSLADATLTVMGERLAQTIFVGFDWRALARVKMRMPQARCWFTTDKLQGEAGPALEFIKASGGDGWFPTIADVTLENVERARHLGLAVAAWTVNDPADMKRLLAFNLEAICTDRPDLLGPMLRD